MPDHDVNINVNINVNVNVNINVNINANVNVNINVNINANINANINRAYLAAGGTDESGSGAVDSLAGQATCASSHSLFL